MLKKLLVNNYTTFINETVFDFERTNYKFLENTNVQDKILKGSLFMGENASGKTKALNAIKILLDLLFGNEEFPFIKQSSLYTTKENYLLEYEFYINNQNIKYKLEFSHMDICKEELYIDNDKVLTRKGEKGESNFDNVLKKYEINSKLLLLRSIYFNTRFDDDKLLIDWFSFMSKSIYVDCFNITVKSYNGNEDNVVIDKYLDKYGTDKLNAIFKKIGYNSTIKYSDRIVNHDIVITDKNKCLFFNKNNTKAYIPFAVESTGNQVFVQIILSFLYACENNCMLLIDEFSSGLHNELEESLIKYFFAHSKNSQIFLVSHSTNLLKTTILRPDQIYSFHFNNGSVIKRFSDESPREGQNLEKMYLSGVFDGLPNYNKFIQDK